MACASHGLVILKVRLMLKQYICITGLVNIKLCGYKWPECVIHPYTCDVISVSDKLARLVSYNSRIGSINSHTAIIVYNHTADIRRFHK